MCPGSPQIYYGDETSRSLIIEGTQGDATLRSFMNWDELGKSIQRGGHEIDEVLAHWQKLGRFRAAHPAVGAGKHQMLSADPYFFKRSWTSDDYNDNVIVGLDLDPGKKSIDVGGVFEDGKKIKDYYSQKDVTVSNGKVVIDSPFNMVLLGK